MPDHIVVTPVERPDSSHSTTFRGQQLPRQVGLPSTNMKVLQTDSPNYDPMEFSQSGYRKEIKKLNRLMQYSKDPENDMAKIQLSSYLAGRTNYSPEYIFQNSQKVLHEVMGYPIDLEVKTAWDYFFKTVKYAEEANQAYLAFETRGDVISKMPKEAQTEAYDLLRKDIESFEKSRPNPEMVESWVPKSIVEGVASTLPYMGRAFMGNVSGGLVGTGIGILASLAFPAGAPVFLATAFLASVGRKVGGMLGVQPLLNANSYVERLTMKNENDEYADPDLVNWGSALSSWLEAAVESVAMDLFVPWVGKAMGGWQLNSIVNSSISRALKSGAISYIKGVGAESIEEGLQSIVNDITTNVIKTLDTKSNGRQWDHKGAGDILITSGKEFLRSLPTMAILGAFSGGISLGVNLAGVKTTQQYDASVHFTEKGTTVPMDTVLFDKSVYDKEDLSARINTAKKGKQKLEPIQAYKIGDVMGEPVYRAVGGQAELTALHERGVRNIRIEEIKREDYVSPLSSEGFQQFSELVNVIASESGAMVQVIDGNASIIVTDKKALGKQKLGTLGIQDLTRADDFSVTTDDFGVHRISAGVSVSGEEGLVDIITEATHAVRNLMYGKEVENFITAAEKQGGDAKDIRKLREMLSSVYDQAHNLDDVHKAVTAAHDSKQEIIAQVQLVNDTLEGDVANLSEVQSLLNQKKKPDIKKSRKAQEAVVPKEIQDDKENWEKTEEEILGDAEKQKDEDSARVERKEEVRKKEAADVWEGPAKPVKETEIDKLTKRAVELDTAAGTSTKIIEDGRFFPQTAINEAKRRGSDPDGIIGLFYNGTVYINAASVKDIDATWAHEWIAHRGLRGLFGNKFDGFLQDTWDSVGKEEIQDKIANFYHNASELEQAEEYLAYLAETKQNGGKITKAERTLLQKLIDALSTMFRNLGAKVAFSNRELLSILSDARSSLGRDTVNINGVRYRVRTIDEHIRFQVAPPVDSENFRSWFKDSVVVDENGDPLIVYHGTHREFTEFGREKRPFSNAHRLWYFSKNQEAGKVFAGESGVVMPVYLSMQNPKILTMGQQDVIEDIGYWATDEQLTGFEAQGYDGLMLEDMSQIVAFSPTQIKSVYNQGTFDPNIADIRFSIDLFDKKDIDSYDGVEYVKHDEGYNYEEKDLRRIDENVQEQLDLFGPEDTEPLFREQFDVHNRSIPTIREDWKRTKRIDFTGTVIQSPQAVAELFSIYRNPELESFHIIYIDDASKILAHNIMSTGLPGSTIAAETDVPGKLSYNMRSRMERLGATGFYIMHNHPTGDIEASRADAYVTKRYADNVPGFKGHIILDHTKFLLMYAKGDDIESLEMSYKPEIFASRELEGEINLQPDQLKKHLSNVIVEKDKSIYIIVDSKYRAIETRPINTPSFKSAYEAMRSINGSFVMLGTTNKKHFVDMIVEANTMQDSKYGVMREMIYLDEDNMAKSYVEIGGEDPLWERHAHKARVKSSTSSFVWEKPDAFDSTKKNLVGMPPRPELTDYFIAKNGTEGLHLYNRMIDEWEEEVEKWAESKGDMLQFGDEKRIELVHKTVSETKPWRVTDFSFSNGEWTPYGHMIFDTKLEAIKEAAGIQRKYRPDIRFSVVDDSIQRLSEEGYPIPAEIIEQYKDTGLLEDAAERNKLVSKYPDLIKEAQAFDSLQDFIQFIKGMTDYNLTDEQLRIIYTTKDVKDPATAKKEFRETIITDEGLMSILGDLDVGIRMGQISAGGFIGSQAVKGGIDEKKLPIVRSTILKNIETYYRDWLISHGTEESMRQLEYEALLLNLGVAVAENVDELLLDADQATRGSIAPTIKDKKLRDQFLAGTLSLTQIDKRLSKNREELYQLRQDLKTVLYDSEEYQRVYNNIRRELDRLHTLEAQRKSGLDKLIARHKKDVQEAVERNLPVPDRVLLEFANEEWASAELANRELFRTYSWVIDLAKDADTPDELFEMINKRLQSEDDDTTVGKEFVEEAFRLGNAQESEQFFINQLTDRISSNGGLTSLLEEISKDRESFHAVGLPRTIWTALQKYERGNLTPGGLDDLRASLFKDLRRTSRAYYIGAGEKEAVSQFRTEDIITGVADDKSLSPADRVKIANLAEDQELKNRILRGEFSYSDLVSYQKKYDTEITSFITGADVAERKIARIEESARQHEQTILTQKAEIRQLERELKAKITKKRSAEIQKEIRRKRDEKIKDISQTYRDRIDRLRKEKNEKLASQKKSMQEAYANRDAVRKMRERMRFLYTRIRRTVPPGTTDYGFGRKLEVFTNLFSSKFTDDEGLKGRPDELLKIMENFNEYSLSEFENAVLNLHDLRMDEFTIEHLEELYQIEENLRADGRYVLIRKNLSRKLMRENVIRKIIKEILHGDPAKLFEAIGSKETKEAQKSSALFKALSATLRPTRMIDKLGGSVLNDWFVEKVNKITDAEIIEWERRHKAGVAKMKELKITAKNLSRQISYNGKTFSADEVIHLEIGILNAKSAAAIIHGNLIDPGIIMGLIGQLTTKELEWGRWMLQDFEENYDRLNEAFIFDKNIDMGKEAYYFPMLRQDLEQKALGLGKEMGQQWAIRNNYRKGYPQKKFTLERIKEIAPEHQTPIRLGATSIWLEQIDKQEHYISSQELVKDLQYISNDQGVKDALKQKFGKAASDWLTQYVNDFASPNLYKVYTQTARFSRILRNNMAIAYLSFNMLTMLKQAPSLGFYLREAGPQHLIAAAYQMISHPIQTLKFVADRDPQMLVRAYNRYQQELMMHDPNKWVEFNKKVGRAGMKPILWMDKAVTTIGWLATYNAKIGKGMSELEAGRAAQKVTLETQPAGRAKDLAQIYREGELQNWLLMFTNQLNQIWNMYTYDLPQATKDHEYRKFSGIVAGLAISGVTISLLAGWRPPDEKKDIPLSLANEMFRNYLASVPIVGNNIKSGYDNQFFFRGLDIIPVAISGGRLFGNIKAGKVDKFTQDLVKVLKDAGVTLGVPVTAITRGAKTVQNKDLIELLGYGFTQHRDLE